MEKIIKIGSVELSEAEAQKIYTEGRFLVTFSRIYQVHYSQAQQRFYGSVIWTQKGGHITRRGRYFALRAAEVNDLVGYELVQ